MNSPTYSTSPSTQKTLHRASQQQPNHHLPPPQGQPGQHDPDSRMGRPTQHRSIRVPGHIYSSYVCEVKMLEKLLDIFGSTRNKEVVNAILGFFTILLSNLNRQPSLNYILSHGVTTCLTMTKFGNMNNEIADYYINFLKVLSRKITSSNLHIFYHEVPSHPCSDTRPFRS
jgi:hypothetical protein